MMGMLVFTLNAIVMLCTHVIESDTLVRWTYAEVSCGACLMINLCMLGGNNNINYGVSSIRFINDNKIIS